MNGNKKNETRQLPPLPNKGLVGGSGGLAIIGGIAGGVVKGAINLVKNVISRSSGVKGATGYTRGSAVRKWGNTKAKTYLAKPKTTGALGKTKPQSMMRKQKPGEEIYRGDGKWYRGDGSMGQNLNI